MSNPLQISHRDEEEHMMRFQHPDTSLITSIHSMLSPNPNSHTFHNYSISKDYTKDFIYINLTTPFNLTGLTRFHQTSPTTHFDDICHAQRPIKFWVQSIGQVIKETQKFMIVRPCPPLRSGSEDDIREHLQRSLHFSDAGRAVLAHMHSDALLISPNSFEMKDNVAEITFIDPYSTSEWQNIVWAARHDQVYC